MAKLPSSRPELLKIPHLQYLHVLIALNVYLWENNSQHMDLILSFAETWYNP